MSRERATAIAAAVAILLSVGAFVAGRFSAPLKVETRDVERVVFKDRVVEKVVTVERAAKVETRIVYRDRVTTRDGTVTEREIERTASKEDAAKLVDSSRVEVRVVEKLVTKTVVTTLRPDWRVAVHAGASLRPPILTIAGPMVLGVEIDRRIAGGLSAGLWVNTSGAVGAAVSFEF